VSNSTEDHKTSRHWANWISSTRESLAQLELGDRPQQASGGALSQLEMLSTRTGRHIPRRVLEPVWPASRRMQDASPSPAAIGDSEVLLRRAAEMLLEPLHPLRH